MEHLIKISDVCQARFSIEAITGRKKEGGRNMQGAYLLYGKGPPSL